MVPLYLVYIILVALAAIAAVLMMSPVTYHGRIVWNSRSRPQLSAYLEARYVPGVFFRARMQVDIYSVDLLESGFVVKVLGWQFGPGEDSHAKRESRRYDGGRQPLTEQCSSTVRKFVEFARWPSRAAAVAGRFLSLAPPTSRFLRNIWKLARPHTVDVEGRYGFEDPFATNQLHIILLAADVSERFSSWNMQPVFDRTENRGAFKIRGRFYGGAVIKAVMTYIVQRPVRRELVALWS